MDNESEYARSSKSYPEGSCRKWNEEQIARGRCLGSPSVCPKRFWEISLYLLDESRSSSRFRIDVFYWCFEKEKIRGSRSMNP